MKEKNKCSILFDVIYTFCILFTVPCNNKNTFKLEILSFHAILVNFIYEKNLNTLCCFAFDCVCTVCSGVISESRLE